jgi:PAS domain S-box-containing protein
VCLEQNRTAEMMFGYTSEEALGRSGIEWIAPEDRDLVMRNMLAGYEEPYEVTAIRKDGTRFPAAIRGRMMSYAGRSVRVTSLTDITAMKRAEDELRRAQRMDLVGRLAGGIAHDFNNVLAAIMSEASLALYDVPEGTAALEDSLAAIVAAAERGATLTQRLLTFARPDRERPRVAVDLGALARGLLPMLRRLVPASIVLAVEERAPSFTIADASQIEQILVNLVVNGRDAITGPGRLDVEVGPIELDAEQAARLEIAPGAYVRLRVADTGSGIAPDVVPRIFEPFFTTKPVGQGTGLGLSVVHGIARQHHGAVLVDSAVGMGTRFDVLLPRSELSAITAPPRVAQAARARPGEVVLLAEDEPAVRRGARRILERAGYEVLEAQDGDEAVALFREHERRVSLVMLDAVMPRTSGRRAYDALATLRPEGLRVLFCSGYSPEELELDLPPGRRYLGKPYLSGDLLSLVRSMLDE